MILQPKDNAARFVVNEPLVGYTFSIWREVAIFRGRTVWPSVLDLANAQWTFAGADAQDNLRAWPNAFEGTRDLNGDGNPDLVLFSAADGPAESRPTAGEIYVFFGPPSRWAARTDLALDSPDVHVFGADADDGLAAMAIADVVGDPTDDLILAASSAGGPSNRRLWAGEVYVLRGRASWPAVVDLRVEPPDLLVYGRGVDDLPQGESLGGSVIVMDWNRDGQNDLGMSGISHDSGRGAIQILHGRTGLTGVWDLQARPADCTIPGPRANAVFGWKPHSGDFDGDGWDELFVGAHGDSTPFGRASAGAVYILSNGWDCAGVRDLNVAPAELVLYGAHPGDGLGYSLWPADIDRDGRADLAFGAPFADGELGNRSRSGVAHILLSGILSPPTCSLSAHAGAPVAVCGTGSSVSLNASATVAISCTTAPEFRWLEGTTVVRDWSPDPMATVNPSATTVYRIQVRCGVFGNSCADESAVVVTVDPDTFPSDLGDSLRQIRVSDDVRFSWASVPDARTYTLHRATSKGVWPLPAFLRGLTSTTASLPDVPWPPLLYFYRVAGASCSGAEGP